LPPDNVRLEFNFNGGSPQTLVGFKMASWPTSTGKQKLKGMVEEDGMGGDGEDRRGKGTEILNTTWR